MRAPFRVVIKCFNYLRREINENCARCRTRAQFVCEVVSEKTHARRGRDVQVFKAKTEFNCRTGDEAFRSFSPVLRGRETSRERKCRSYLRCLRTRVLPLAFARSRRGENFSGKIGIGYRTGKSKYRESLSIHQRRGPLKIYQSNIRSESNQTRVSSSISGDEFLPSNKRGCLSQNWLG